jgi:exonuclease SbcD
MKFLQTSDWHLGKVFYETSLIEDQKHFLSEITHELTRAKERNSPYDALVIPGDIYDRAVPPADAVSLLSEFLASTHFLFPELHIVMLAGNHDSAARLGFGSDLFESSNIHICSDTSTYTKPIIINGAAFYQLPFLTPGSIAKGNLFDSPLRTQNELYETACSRIADAHKKNYPDIPSILCAHAYVLGASNPEMDNSSTGTSSVGTAELVKSDFFSPFAYTAFGHIHKFQKIGGKIEAYYSGSPLAYNFDDTPDKYMLSVTIGTHSSESKDNKNEKPYSISVEKISFHPLHPVVRLTGTFRELYDAKDTSQYKDSFVDIQCTDDTIIENPIGMLRKKYPFILSFTRSRKTNNSKDTTFEERRRVLSESGEKSPVDVFDLFIKDLYGTSLDPIISDERTLFTELCKKSEASE